MTEPAPQPLTDPAQIAELSESIRRCGVFALDSEFISEGAYSPQLALVQVATPEWIALIDPLAEGAPDQPIWDAMADPEIATVVHAHDQETRFCYERAGAAPQNLFDVQLAAAFCGHRFPISYGGLLDEELGVQAAASQSRTDWTRRPLSGSQLRYAADDVRWLLPLREQLCARLADDERAGWLREEMQLRITALKDDDAEAETPAAATSAWRKLSGTRRLNRRGLAALRELHAWRAGTAKAANRPLKRIARDEALVAVAQMLPDTLEDLQRVRGVETVPRRYRPPILAAVQRAAALPDDRLPERIAAPPQPPRTLTAFVDALLDALCAERSIDTKLVAASADVREIVAWARNPRTTHPTPRLLQGWRKEFAGDQIIAAIEGRISLRIADPRAEQPLVAEPL